MPHELRYVECFRCGCAESDAEFSICALDNRWIPLCAACLKVEKSVMRAFVSALGGRRIVKRQDVSLLRIVGIGTFPDDSPLVACSRCTTGRGWAFWSLYSAGETLLCRECDLEANRVALEFLGAPRREWRMRRYEARLDQSIARLRARRRTGCEGAPA